MSTGLRNSIGINPVWLTALGTMIALGAAQPVQAAQALLVCTIVQAPGPDNTNTVVKILNNCCANLPAGTKITVTAGQESVPPASITLTLAKPLKRHQTTQLGFYVSVPRPTWCSARSQ